MDLPLNQIWIDRDSRQRKEIVVDDLLASIPLHGVIVPVIVTSEPGPNDEPYKLLAGERRYTASTQLSLPTIPARLLSELSTFDQRVVELEENLRRKDLTWQDQCMAIADLHATLAEKDPDWTFARTGDQLGYTKEWVRVRARVARELHREVIRNMDGLTRAFNMICREDERVAGDAISNILSSSSNAASEAIEDILAEAGNKKAPEASPSSTSAPSDSSDATRLSSLIPPSEDSILQQSFLDWAPNYKGEPFNLIHCDFPYGVNVFGGKWSGRQSWSEYNDQADIYIQLIKCLCENLDRLMAHSAHLVFWLSADIKIQAKTLELFAEFAPTLAFCQFPLVWLKSDNVGIMPDPKREPRRICETALIASREDRFLLKPVSNAIAAQTNKEHHPHTKPEPVLKHFLQMFVDSNTRFLDPTCGGGSSLRAAEALGAEFVLGLEIDDNYVSNARRALNHSRVLRKASSLQKEPKNEQLN